MSELPKPPSGLRAPGRALWDSVADLEFTAGELEILRQAVRTVDEADKLERELRKAPAMVEGYAGQPRPNPLYKVLQDHRILIRKLVDSLNIPYADEESGLRATQRHAQKAANTRWRNAREVS
jgi:hypothetical protein